MASWRENASSQSQDDLDCLLDAALGFAQQQLDARGEFFPYAAAIGTDGEAELITARPDADDERPRSVDVIDACVAALVSQRDYIRAGAIVADVRLADQNRDAIRVELEHVEGHALAVLLPYTKKKFRRGVEYGPLRSRAGSRRIWG